MAVMAALSLVLVVGFGATALVGFLSWRERIAAALARAPVDPDASRDRVDP